MSYYQQKRYREAALQLQNAIKIDPEYADAHYLLAQCYISLHMVPPAFAELYRTIELAPKNWKAQIDMGTTELASHHAQQAADKAKLVLESEPQNVDAHTLMANSLAAMGNYQGAMDEFQVALRIDPNRASTYIKMGMEQEKAQHLPAAEDSYKKAVALDPHSVGPILALGGFYAEHDRLPESEQQFRAAMETDPKDLVPRQGLVNLYLMQGKQNEAIDLMKQTKQALSNNSEAYQMLGEFYGQTSQLDKAVEEYASLYHDHPKDPDVRANYTKMLITANRLSDAIKLTDGFLKENPSDSNAMFARAEIWVLQGRAAEAIPLFQSTLKTDPNNTLGHYNLGVAYLKSGFLEQAHNEWEETIRLLPDMVLAQEALADLAIKKNDLAEAGKNAGDIITAYPAAPAGYNLRGVVEAHQGNAVAAEADFKKAMELAPRDALAYTHLGEIRLAQRKLPEAAVLCEQALGLNPAIEEALGCLVTSMTFQGKPANVIISRIQDQITRVPNSSEYYLMLGEAYFGLRDYEKAQGALQESVTLNRHNAQAAILLAQAQTARGFLPQALSTAETTVQQNPHDIRTYEILGLLQEKAGDWQKAEDTYQKALLVDPAFGVGANNLACLLIDHGGNVDLALSLAQTARNIMPQSSVTADTLAWAYVQKGVYGSALDLLKKAATQDPNSATVHYHLGVTYLRMKNPAAATAQFRQVLKLDPDYVKGPEIRKLLADAGKG